MKSDLCSWEMEEHENLPSLWRVNRRRDTLDVIRRERMDGISETLRNNGRAKRGWGKIDRFAFHVNVERNRLGV